MYISGATGAKARATNGYCSMINLAAKLQRGMNLVVNVVVHSSAPLPEECSTTARKHIQENTAYRNSISQALSLRDSLFTEFHVA